jgi:myo-inositol-1(or 4)-monophosphatase
MLNTAVKAARKAGDLQLRAARDLTRLTIENKGDPNNMDFVTDIDKACERAIVETLLMAYPDHTIMAEEGTPGLVTESDYKWIIDPIDGTHNFMHGVPHYCVSIALEHRGIITQAVIYDPSRNDLFTATRGAGAFVNNKRMRVSATKNTREAIVGTGTPFKDPALFDPYFEMFKSVMPVFSGMRRAGAAALDMAYVAAGWYDCFWELKLKPWDIAAGSLLILEAGGIITDLNGNEGYMDNGNVVCGNPKMFAELLKLINPHAKHVL